MKKSANASSHSSQFSIFNFQFHQGGIRRATFGACVLEEALSRRLFISGSATRLLIPPIAIDRIVPSAHWVVKSFIGRNMTSAKLEATSAAAALVSAAGVFCALGVASLRL